MLRREFVDAFAEFRRLDNEADGVAVRAVVVSGNRRAFYVGADVDEFVDGTVLAHPEVVYETASRFAGPVVAEIDGYCLGGGLVLALSCGVCFAGERFRTLDVNYLIPTRRGATEEDVLEKMTARGEEVAVERARIDMVTGAHECRFLYVPSSSGEGTVIFVTNVDVRPETVVSFCRRYSRCWQIEAEYKSIKNDFLAKTSSRITGCGCSILYSRYCCIMCEESPISC